MELYAKTVNTVYFEKPTDDTAVTGAKYSINGGAFASVPFEDAAGKASAKLPYSPSEAQVTVRWSFVVPGSGSFTDDTYYDIVTPYLSLAEVKAIHTSATDEEARAVEAAVRHVINAHTGQSFGYGSKSITVEGHGESALRLPERLVTLTGLATLTATLDINSVIIVSDGWYIKKAWAQETSRIDSDSTYWYGNEVINDVDPGEPGYEKNDHGPVIDAPTPGGRPTKWRDDYPFTVTGAWGYKSVPEAVRSAAKLLVNDYACSEIAYRDKYLESIKSADWRLQFSSRSWEYTGNVRADQLLSEFVLLDWAVV